MLIPIVAALTLMANVNDQKAEPKAEKELALLVGNPLKGMWRLVQNEEGKPEVIADRKMTKFFGDKHWNTAHGDSKSGLVSVHAGGTYKIKGDLVSETIEYTLPDKKHLIGETNRFNFKILAGKLHFIALDRKWDKVWERVE